MPLVVKDRVRETTTTTGTGTVTLNGAVSNFQSFTAIGDGNTTFYTIALDSAGEWEVGIGTYTASGTTLSRDIVLESSNSGSLVPFSAGTKTVFVTYPAEKSVADGKTNIIEVSSTDAALRITQTGTGNALVVEDSANPDSTPFVVDANGRVITGYTSALNIPDGTSSTQRTPQSQLIGISSIGGTIQRWSADAASGFLSFGKSRSSTIGNFAVVSPNDDLGSIAFCGDDGTALIPAANILAEVDGTPGTNDMPGRLVFSTTADGASSPTERMRIDNQGRIGFNSTSLGAGSGQYRFAGNITGSTASAGLLYTPSVQSDVTVQANIFTTQPSTQDAAFTLSDLRHFFANQGTITGGSRTAPTNQYGYVANSTLTGATNNYGFYSNIASGTGRWNFYANGTAANYFGGETTISVNSTSDALRITQTGTGNALVVEDSANPDSTPFVIDAAGRVMTGIPAAQGSIFGGGYNPQIQVWGTGPATASQSFASFNTAGTGNGSRMWLTRSRGSFTAGVPTYGIVSNGDSLGDIQFSGDDGTVGGNFVTAAQILAQVDGTPGTNDMPGRLVFSTTADGASTPTERLRISSSGAIDMAATSSLQKNSINAYTLKNITYLTSGTAATYTTPTGVRALKVTVVGGGGGGGGVNGSTTASTNAYSDGGGGAGYAIAFIPSAEASYTYTVGAGGTGGAAGNNAGAAGGTTEFKNAGSTVIVSATGGSGGLGDTGATSTGATTGDPGVGSITGLGTPGGVIGSGTGRQSNGYGRYINGTSYSLSSGGYCPFIGGGVISNVGTGINATNYGEGGGPVRTATAVGTDFAGGNGFAGLIIVEEYF